MAIFSLQRLVIEFISQNEKDVQYRVLASGDRGVCCLPAGRWPGPRSQTSLGPQSGPLASAPCGQAPGCGHHLGWSLRG